MPLALHPQVWDPEYRWACQAVVDVFGDKVTVLYNVPGVTHAGVPYQLGLSIPHVRQTGRTTYHRLRFRGWDCAHDPDRVVCEPNDPAHPPYDLNQQTDPAAVVQAFIVDTARCLATPGVVPAARCARPVPACAAAA